jgi:hypothetical protein
MRPTTGTSPVLEAEGDHSFEITGYPYYRVGARRGTVVGEVGGEGKGGGCARRGRGWKGVDLPQKHDLLSPQGFVHR